MGDRRSPKSKTHYRLWFTGIIGAFRGPWKAQNATMSRVSEAFEIIALVRSPLAVARGGEEMPYVVVRERPETVGILHVVVEIEESR